LIQRIHPFLRWYLWREKAEWYNDAVRRIS
jgi:hypothetical protein